MDILIYGAIVLMTLIGVWSAILCVSIARMVLTVKSIRGSTRKSDIMHCGLVGLLSGSIAFLFSQFPYILSHLSGPVISLMLLVLFVLGYTTERHIKNYRNIRAIKRRLTNNKQ